MVLFSCSYEEIRNGEEREERRKDARREGKMRGEGGKERRKVMII